MFFLDVNVNVNVSIFLDFSLMETECVTVTSFVLEQKKKYPGASGELTILLNTLLTAIKGCAAAVRKAGIAKL